MRKTYILLDKHEEPIYIDTFDNEVYISFPVDASQAILCVDEAQQLIEHLKQALIDIKGSTT